MMCKDKTKLAMQVLGFQSMLVAGLGALLPLIAQYEGKKPESWSMLCLFVGLVGVSAYSVLSILIKRITHLEELVKQNSVKDSPAF
jgi:uncharacterized protein with PQ loop repeat